MLATTTAAPSWKQLLRYVIPAASAMVLFSLYTVIDGILVAHGGLHPVRLCPGQREKAGG